MAAAQDRLRRERLRSSARPEQSRKPAKAAVDTLTAGERRIAEMATHGLSDREIAQALFVTPKSVETHMSNVLQKLNIGSRKDLEPVISRAARTP
jgi:DNA-binding NarL/FixJ family response regulator